MATARRLLGTSDSKILDQALSALIDRLEGEREVAALAALPYEDDPELTWPDVAGPNLPYDGEVPAEVLRLAARRRRQQRSKP